MSYIHRTDDTGRIDYILVYRVLFIMVRHMEHGISCGMDVDYYKRRKDTVMTERYKRMCDHPDIQERIHESCVFYCKKESPDNPIYLLRIEDWMGLCGYNDNHWHEFLDDLLIMRRVTHEAKQERITIHEACALVFMNDHAYIWDDEKGWVK